MKRTFVAQAISEIPKLSHGIQDRRPRHSKHPSLLAMPAAFSAFSITLVGRFPELTPVRSQTTSRGFLPWMPVTVRNTYPLPLIPQLINKAHARALFTKFDIRWGYNNVCIQRGDEWKAAFITNEGLFEPTVMFFSVKFCLPSVP